jgi:hypothetical protein
LEVTGIDTPSVYLGCVETCPQIEGKWVIGRGGRHSMEKNANQQQVQEWLSQIEVGEGMHHENLTIFPVFWQGGGSEADRYDLLSEAVEAEEAVVEEVSEGGDVPFLGVKNEGAKPILIPEGEILIGAKQNRVVNLTVLVAAKTTFQLPVSCVEQGRWHYRTRRFKPAAFAHPKLRDMKVRSAQVNRMDLGIAVADQGQVWDEVDDHLEDFCPEAPTRDFMDSYEAAGERLEGYREKMELPDRACGFVAARGSEVVGLDLFDTPKTMRKLWDRMADAYFIEAARDPGKYAATSKETVDLFIENVSEALRESEKQPDLGVEFEVSDNRFSGAALYYDGAVCHLSAFSSEATAP